MGLVLQRGLGARTSVYPVAEDFEPIIPGPSLIDSLEEHAVSHCTGRIGALRVLLKFTFTNGASQQSIFLEYSPSLLPLV